MIIIIFLHLRFKEMISSIRIFTELFGRHWEEIATASGLVSSATILIIAVFIPKVNHVNYLEHSSSLTSLFVRFT